SNATGTVTETHSGTNQTSYAIGDLLYASAANTLSKLAGNTTTTKKFLTQTGDGTNSAAPVWGTIGNSDLANSSVTVNAGTGMSGGGTVSLGGAITLTNAGVTSLTGTSNQVNVSASVGSVTLSLPQAIATGSSPTFASL